MFYGEKRRMRVVEIKEAKAVKKFINMADDIYRGDKFYVPYMRRDLYKTLCALVLKHKTYTALAVERNGKFIARVLFTVGAAKRIEADRCGYFSHFECVNDVEVCKLLLEHMCKMLKERGISRVEGTYFPHDQDNRRGILAEGFEYPPMIFTSYNPPYYNELLTACGFKKDFDTVAYRFDFTNVDMDRIERLTERVKKRCGLELNIVNFNNLDSEIEAFYGVMKKATTDVIFQEAPTMEALRSIVTEWKNYLWADLIYIVRRTGDNLPVGVMLSLPDYNGVFRKMNGRINPVSIIKMLYYKKRISSVRPILQYVIPEYHNLGVNYVMYYEFFKTCKRYGIENIEAGTIMEDNLPSRMNLEHAGGFLNKIFRIYGREI